MKKQIKKRVSKKPKRVSPLESLMALQMRAYGLPAFEREYKFHPTRKWRFDFFLEGWGVEINGGGWDGGGHNRNPIVMGKDYEKYNAAQEMGIKVLIYTGEMVKDLSAIEQLIRIFK